MVRLHSEKSNGMGSKEMHMQGDMNRSDRMNDCASMNGRKEVQGSAIRLV